MDESNEINLFKYVYKFDTFCVFELLGFSANFQKLYNFEKNKQEKTMKSESCDHCKSSLHVDQDYDAFSCVFLDLH